MTNRNIVLSIGAVIVVGVVGYFSFFGGGLKGSAVKDMDSTPQPATLSGTYTCLPHIDTTGPQTTECAFGFQTDDGIFYAVNFGAGADAMGQFQSGSHVTAEGFVILKSDLDSNQWDKYNMKGMFTVTNIIATSTPGQGKLNINVVCESALSYMTFPDSAHADAYVAECKEGKHPEVIEHYKAQMNLGDGATI